MAFIKIISLPGGQATCSEYFFKDHKVGPEKCSIKIGEVAEVPDEELSGHLATCMVQQVTGADDAGVKRRGRPPKSAAEDGYNEVFAAQR